MATQGHGYNIPRVSVCGSGIFADVCFLGINMAPDMLEIQSRSIKTRTIAWIPKNMSQKMAYCVGAQGRMKLPKNAKHPH